ncbi:MAG: hypothetical protein ACRYFX_00630 [Janthinobacterium lividum]
MPAPTELRYFTNPAGQVAAHLDGYAVLRSQPGKRPPAELPALLTELGHLLLRNGWVKFLADNREMTPLTAAEKDWFSTQWLGRRVARPTRLVSSLVLPHEVVARLSLLEMHTHAAKSNITYATFTDLAPAEAYLSAA